ncbi:MAG: hypothetical protein PHF86_02810 [Candidatus Nanoarchaeia archaeon]|nr:hypothetical protein [Candidatus Nanoarchaeia archaeon]
MSNKIVVQFSVSNMSVMEDTLKRLGHAYVKDGSNLKINRPYYPISINSNEISCDSMNKSEVNVLIYEYQRDFYIKERIVRGESYEVTETNNEIIITVT